MNTSTRSNRAAHLSWGSLLLLVLGLVLAAGAETARAAACTDLISAQQNLAGCNLNQAHIGAAPALLAANLSNANLNHATVTGVGALLLADLSGADLNHVAITNTKGTPLALIGATLTGADLNHATIRGAGVLLAANLTGANLNHATISGAGALLGANLTNANLNGASIGGQSALLGAVYNNTTCPDGSNSNQDGGTCAGHLTASEHAATDADATLSWASADSAAPATVDAVPCTTSCGGGPGGCTSSGCIVVSANGVSVAESGSLANGGAVFNGSIGADDIVFSITVDSTDSGTWSITGTSDLGPFAESGSLANGGAV